MQKIKNQARKIIRAFGFDLVRAKVAKSKGCYIAGSEFGWDAFSDMRHLIHAESEITICDIGANIGQSAEKFSKLFPHATIHSFEPSPSTFRDLVANCASMPWVRPWNLGVGSRLGSLELIENSNPDMSSFLTPGETTWGEIVRSTEVPITTLDQFAKEKGIDFIHILKSDTQGYDFEVLKGASGLLGNQKIGFVHFEFIFSNMYANLPPFEEIFSFLSERGYRLVSFYDICYQNNVASWMDALFVSAKFKAEHLKNDNHVVFPAGKNPFAKPAQ
jgi:FkbM family methyltransferase